MSKPKRPSDEVLYDKINQLIAAEWEGWTFEQKVRFSLQLAGSGAQAITQEALNRAITEAGDGMVKTDEILAHANTGATLLAREIGMAVGAAIDRAVEGAEDFKVMALLTVECTRDDEFDKLKPHGTVQ